MCFSCLCVIELVSRTHCTTSWLFVVGYHKPRCAKCGITQQVFHNAKIIHRPTALWRICPHSVIVDRAGPPNGKSSYGCCVITNDKNVHSVVWFPCKIVLPIQCRTASKRQQWTVGNPNTEWETIFAAHSSSYLSAFFWPWPEHNIVFQWTQGQWHCLNIVMNHTTRNAKKVANFPFVGRILRSPAVVKKDHQLETDRRLGTLLQ